MATRDSVVLALSSQIDVGRWISPDDDEEAQRVADNMGTPLESARQIISSRVSHSRLDPDDPPAALHQACKMKAAQIAFRNASIYGIEAYALGGQAGGYLLVDPTIAELIAPWEDKSPGVVIASRDSDPIAYGSPRY